ncbi:short chain dehydrogenase [Rickenella mellea]|uniref:Short chain dehydrogenase n=1 Tax=Rickenella mellea TaxID=50990 RepID=A0A4Y7PLG9_9AGAM|nr:short chain dehydrogenase [Rickenella mellea]
MVNWDINRDMPNLSGKVAIVTGGNTGLGRELVKQLALHNAKVYMASRTESRALAAIDDLNKENPDLSKKAGVFFLQLDLSNITSCQTAARNFLEKESRLDILINNAGIMATPFELTTDGFDVQFQSNYLGHFAFTIPLLPVLIQTSKDPTTSVRIVQVSSMGHKFADGNVKFDSIESVNRDFGSPWKRYGQSKLANILFAKELARRLENERIFSSSLHPGNIKTELVRGPAQSYPLLKPLMSLMNFALLTPYKGAITPLYAATSPDVESNNWRGEYFVPLAKKTEPSALARNAELAKDLWVLSEKIINEKSGNQ